jgi:hypothetical protein
MFALVSFRTGTLLIDFPPSAVNIFASSRNLGFIMRIARLGFCVFVFSCLGAISQAQAGGCYDPPRHYPKDCCCCCCCEAPYWTGSYPTSHGCGGCSKDCPKHAHYGGGSYGGKPRYRERQYYGAHSYYPTPEGHGSYGKYGGRSYGKKYGGYEEEYHGENYPPKPYPPKPQYGAYSYYPMQDYHGGRNNYPQQGYYGDQNNYPRQRYESGGPDYPDDDEGYER